MSGLSDVVVQTWERLSKTQRKENEKAPFITEAWWLRMSTSESPGFKFHLTSLQVASLGSEPQFAHGCYSPSICVLTRSAPQKRTAGSMGLNIRCWAWQTVIWGVKSSLPCVCVQPQAKNSVYIFKWAHFKCFYKYLHNVLNFDCPSTKPKIFITWPFEKKLTDPCSGAAPSNRNLIWVTYIL